MSTIGNVAAQNNVSSTSKTRGFPAGSIRFDAVMTIMIYWFMIGLYIDGGAHQRGLVDESFFTPWHAVLYSGATAVAVVLGTTQIRNVLKGYPFLRALPYGYFPALIGVGIFAVGGILDLTWHTLFGTEVSMEALLSPSHLILASGAFLFISGPFRAAWARQDAAGWRTLLPAMFSAAAILSQMTFFTQYANFAARPLTLIDLPAGAGGDHYFFNLYGVMSMLIPSSLGMAFILLMLRRWTLPVGALTLMSLINTALMIWLRLPFLSNVLPVLVAVPLGAMLADFFLWRFNPSMNRPTILRLFAFTVPFVTSLIYMLILNTFGSGLWWQIHMWLGVPFLAGIAGLFLSFLAAPPAIPQESAKNEI